ncbi:MAG: hypothetical protein AABX38_04430 [Candidatus Micrarchaeota archaeon]
MIQQVLKVSYQITSEGIKPLVEARVIIQNDDVLALLAKQVLSEGLVKRKSEEEVLAKTKVKESNRIEKKKGSAKEGEFETRTYILSYFNPELDKAEELEETTELEIKDPIQASIEEAVGEKSTFKIYSFIASPIIRKEINPEIVKEILENRDYDTPPKFGGAQIVRILNSSNSKIKIIPAEAYKATIEMVKRKELIEKRVVQQIVVLEKVQEDIKISPNLQKILDKLPPLTRARMLIALRKKKLDQIQILKLLEKDSKFLKEVKKKLETMTTSDLLAIVRAIKELNK